jgi:transposase
MVKLDNEPINPINMRRSRRKFSAKFKSTVVLEALKEQKTISELAQHFEVHPNQISMWKREFLDNAEAAFGEKPSKSEPEEQVNVNELYSQIGQLKVENDFLKKSLRKTGL